MINTKFEYLNPKQIQNSNIKIRNNWIPAFARLPTEVSFLGRLNRPSGMTPKDLRKHRIVVRLFELWAFVLLSGFVLRICSLWSLPSRFDRDEFPVSNLFYLITIPSILFPICRASVFSNRRPPPRQTSLFRFDKWGIR